MRLLQSLGVADAVAGDMLAFRDYHWFGADGELLMRIEAQTPAVSGWEPDYMFFQPALEAALDARAREHAGVTVERGWVAQGLEQDAEGARLTLGRDGDTRTVRARYVIGADGANSFVRETLGIERRDLGFRERWLVVDVAPHDMTAIDLPVACQWCDPARPTTHVQSGTGHRRWEFMLLPGESPDDFEDEQRSWDLLAPWFAPADGILLRHAVYEFRSMLAERMRDGRVLLAGDAAHLTPPFLGQGLCAGLRDAANIAWKLDLVLRGRADAALLDTVTPERQPQNEWIIAFAVELGKALCQLDPQLAAERDAAVRAAGPPPHVALPPLVGGVVRAGDRLGGQLAVQGRVSGDAGDGLLDDVAGGGFTLIVAGAASLDDATAALAAELTVRTITLDPGAPGGLRDLDGRLTAWLADHDAHAVLVRPDFYAFGSAGSAADIPALLRDLREQLSPTTA
jgi:2-polyprenyl-6-methoxyphenol hydroxylase-like FAD-dependent oxidoreductase